MCIRLSAFRKIWNVDRNGNIVINAHTCLDMDADSDTVQKHYWIDFTLLDCEQEMKYGLNFPPLWVVIHFLLPVSHVQSHPGMHASNPGWLWTCMPVFEFERVVRYQEYTHGFVVPLWLLYHPRNWNLIFLFRLRTESLTTISITCFLCPSKEGTKSVHGNKICEKFIVIYNVHTLSYKNI